MAATDCIICGGQRFLDERGMPSCDACEPLLAAHVVSNRIDQQTGEALAVCPCGWSTRHPWSAKGRWDRELATVEHWRSATQVTP